MMLKLVALGMTYKHLPAKDYINKYVKDETYRKNKNKRTIFDQDFGWSGLTINIIMNIDKKEEIVQKCNISWF